MYLQQVALIVLMAHVGSFVPAEEAHIGVVDRYIYLGFHILLECVKDFVAISIFTRFDSSSDPEFANFSSFQSKPLNFCGSTET